MDKALDRVVMKAAVNVSRRGFLRKLGGLGFAGFGVAGIIGPAPACDPCDTPRCGPCDQSCRWCVYQGVTYHVCRNLCGVVCTQAPIQCG